MSENWKLSPPKLKAKLGEAARGLEEVEEELRHLAALAPPQKGERLRDVAERVRSHMLTVKIAAGDLPDEISYREPRKDTVIRLAEREEGRREG